MWRTPAKQYPQASTDEGWRDLLIRYHITENDLSTRVQQQIDVMRLVDARFVPAVQIDSKSIEAYYRDKFVPQLNQSGIGERSLGGSRGQNSRAPDATKSQ